MQNSNYKLICIIIKILNLILVLICKINEIKWLVSFKQEVLLPTICVLRIEFWQKKEMQHTSIPTLSIFIAHKKFNNIKMRNWNLWLHIPYQQEPEISTFYIYFLRFNDI